MTDEHGNEEQEGFGQASLGDAQSSDPPADPEMIDSEDDSADNPERSGPDAPHWKPTDEPDPNEEGAATGPPPESAPGDSGEASTPHR
jgi:hypothetical protein